MEQQLLDHKSESSNEDGDESYDSDEFFDARFTVKGDINEVNTRKSSKRKRGSTKKSLSMGLKDQGVNDQIV